MPTARVNDVTLYYESMGEGEPLFFIHGLGSSTRDWEPQFEAFRDRYHCVALDVRGHGQSEKPPGPYSVRQFSVDALALMAHLGIKSAHIVGISMGGGIAFQMAVDAPAAVLSMVIINSGPEIRFRTLKDRLEALRRLVFFRLLSMEQIGEVLGQRLFPAEAQAAIREQFVARWAENDKRAYMDSTRALAGWGVREQIGTIDIPTLVLASDQDYTPVELKQEYVGEMPDAELVVIKEARHAVTFTHPEQANGAIIAFLERIADRERTGTAGE
jgi:pimeloyl-ACP methyl ester carboxylesterase